MIFTEREKLFLFNFEIRLFNTSGHLVRISCALLTLPASNLDFFARKVRPTFKLVPRADQRLKKVFGFVKVLTALKNKSFSNAQS